MRRACGPPGSPSGPRWRRPSLQCSRAWRVPNRRVPGPDPRTRPKRACPGARPQDTPETGLPWGQTQEHAPNRRALAERGRVDGLPVAPHVPVLGAEYEQDEILLADADDLARSRRRHVAEPARAELSRLAREPEARAAAVYEIQLVLFLVVVRPRLDARRKHERVRAESRDSEALPDLPEDAVAELVERRKRETHAR